MLNQFHSTTAVICPEGSNTFRRVYVSNSSELNCQFEINCPIGVVLVELFSGSVETKGSISPLHPREVFNIRTVTACPYDSSDNLPFLPKQTCPFVGIGPRSEVLACAKLGQDDQQVHASTVQNNQSCRDYNRNGSPSRTN